VAEVGLPAFAPAPQLRRNFPRGRRSRGTPRAASGMTTRLRDPADIHAADGRLEDQVVLAEGRPGGRLNPDWVEWLLGFPAGRSRSTPKAEPEGEVGRPDHQAAPVAAPGATRVAAAPAPSRAGFAHHGGDRRGPEKLRSPRHLEARS
jgi:RuvB AAA lid domain